MKQRIGRLLDRDPSGLWIGTFHSLSARLLRREAELLGFSRQFTIYDEDDRLSLIKRLMDQRGHSTKMFPPRAVQSLISAAKNRMVPPSELAAGVSPFDRLAQVAADVYGAMGPALKAANAMDFDDLLLHPLTLFREHPDRLRAYQAQVQLHPGGRVPGHQPGAVPADPPARRARQRLRRGRRRPVDLRLARRRRAQHAGLPQGFPGRQAGPAGGELPLHPGGARRRQRGDRGEQRPDREDAHAPGGGAASR